MRIPSEYKGKTLQLKQDSPTFLDIQKENKTTNNKDKSTAIVIEDWAENVCKKETFYTKDKLYGHLDKSHLARIVSIDELEIESSKIEDRN